MTTSDHSGPDPQIPSHLFDGYQAFVKGPFQLEAERYAKLARQQKPETMIIGCCDSRVDPATIFTAAPGELFVVRNIAALVPPCEDDGGYHGTSAAVEFAVTSLKVRNIVVLGHGLCGGVAAALASAEERPVGQFIKPWVDMLADVRERLLNGDEAGDAAERQHRLELLSVQQSLANLMTFPFLAEAVRAGDVRLHGAWYSIADAQLKWLDRDSGLFVTVKGVPGD